MIEKEAVGIIPADATAPAAVPPQRVGIMDDAVNGVVGMILRPLHYSLLPEIPGTMKEYRFPLPPAAQPFSQEELDLIRTRIVRLMTFTLGKNIRGEPCHILQVKQDTSAHRLNISVSPQLAEMLQTRLQAQSSPSAGGPADVVGR